jgi:hypothetical protein
MGQAVRPQRLGIERTGAGERAWLSMLIDTMETISHREVQTAPCDARLLTVVSLQLRRSVGPPSRASHAAGSVQRTKPAHRTKPAI